MKKYHFRRTPKLKKKKWGKKKWIIIILLIIIVVMNIITIIDHSPITQEKYINPDVEKFFQKSTT